MTLRQLYCNGTPADGTAATAANTAAATFLVPSGNTATWRTATGAHGNAGIALVAGVTNTSAIRVLATASNARLAFTGLLTAPNAQTTNTYTVLNVSAGGSAVMRLQFRNNGDLGLYDASSVARGTFANGTLAWGTQYVVQLNISTAGVYRIVLSTLAGVVVNDFSGSGANFGSSALDRVDLFPGGSVGNHGWAEVQLDDGNTTLIPAYSPATSYSGTIALGGAGTLSTSAVVSTGQALQLSGAGSSELSGTPRTPARFEATSAGQLTTESAATARAMLATSASGTAALSARTTLQDHLELAALGTLGLAGAPTLRDLLGRAGEGSTSLRGAATVRDALPTSSVGQLDLTGTAYFPSTLTPRRTDARAPGSRVTATLTRNTDLTVRVP